MYFTPRVINFHLCLQYMFSTLTTEFEKWSLHMAIILDYPLLYTNRGKATYYYVQCLRRYWWCCSSRTGTEWEWKQELPSVYVPFPVPIVPSPQVQSHTCGPMKLFPVSKIPTYRYMIDVLNPWVRWCVHCHMPSVHSAPLLVALCAPSVVAYTSSHWSQCDLYTMSCVQIYHNYTCNMCSIWRHMLQIDI